MSTFIVTEASTFSQIAIKLLCLGRKLTRLLRFDRGTIVLSKRCPVCGANSGEAITMASQRRSLEQIRDKLARQRAEVEQRLVHLHSELLGATASGHLEGNFTNHPADASSDTLLAETDVSTIRELEHELADFDAALKRIEHGAFGQCIDCGDQIDPARLEARPTAIRCLRCQGRWELKQPHEVR